MNMSAPVVDRVAMLPSAYRFDPARNEDSAEDDSTSEGMEWNPVWSDDIIIGESRFLLWDSS